MIQDPKKHLHVFLITWFIWYLLKKKIDVLLGQAIKCSLKAHLIAPLNVHQKVIQKKECTKGLIHNYIMD